jgi:hypothetical protein
MAVQSVNRSSATASLAKTEDHTAKATLENMKANLIRHARSDDRNMLLRSLREVKLLNCLSLDAVQRYDGQFFDLEKECAAGRIILNGVDIKGVKSTGPGSEKVSNSSSVPVLKGFCRILSEKEGIKTSSRELYEKLIVRLARSSSSADPYFRLNSLLGSADLLVMPLEHEVATGADEAVLAEMYVYASNGEIHMTLSQTYKFGLLRKSDVKSNRPWLIIDAIVKERANLTSNTGVRELKVALPEM